MITGPIYEERLTIENILSKITPYDIYRYYLMNVGVMVFRINREMSSPYHKDDNPSFLISDRGGTLHHIDFADTSKRGDCFQFVRDLLGISSLPETLAVIDRDFGLGLSGRGSNIGAYKTITKGYEQPEISNQRPSKIQVITRKFSREELAYWNNFYQDISDLRDENVYAPKKIYLDGKLYNIPLNEIAFGYLYEEKYWKIYRPFAPSKKEKWLSNVPITCMDGKQNIINCEKAFINKSKKDYLFMKKLIPTSCGIQNEGLACFSDENVDYIKNNSKKQILGFDNDEPGVKNSIQITKIFGFDYCNVPKEYLDEKITDWADWGRFYGIKEVKKYLIEKGII